MRKIFISVLLSVFISLPVLGETIYETKTTLPVAAGITRTTIRRFATEGFQYINVVEANLANKFVSADIVLPEKGISALESPLSMANKNNTSVLINGDFFASNSSGGSPVGAVVKEGEVLSTSGGDKMASFGIFDGVPVTDYFEVTAKITAENGKSVDIRHINKYDPLDAVCLYTGDFYKTTPGAVNNIWEVLVVNGVIEQINNNGESVEIPENGYVLRSLPEYNSFVPDNLKVGEKLKLEISTSFDLEKAEMLIGGGTLLVKNGEKAEITHNVSGNNPRTALGTDKTGKKLYLITVDGRNNYSAGMTLSALADFMLEYGIYNGINFDGGGSTAMVVKDFTTSQQSPVHSMADSSYLRPVTNGLGIYSTAPKGRAKSFEIKGDNAFAGLTADFEVVNVKDQYGNPSDGKVTPVYSVDSRFGYFEGNTLYAAKSGNNVEIKATFNGFTAKTYIDICPLDRIEPVPSHFPENAELPDFKVFGYTKEGEKLLLNERDVSVKGNRVVAGGKEAKLIFSNIVEIFSSDFKTEGYPKDKVTVSGKYDRNVTLDGNGSFKLTFDFTDSDKAAKAAYVTVNKDLNGEKYGLLAVYSGENRQWLRGEFADSEGNVLRADICPDMDFTGWKLIPFEIPENAVKLTRIYLVQNMYENRNRGSVYFDSLSLSDTLPEGLEIKENQAQLSEEKGNSHFTVFAGVSPVRNLLSSSLKTKLEEALSEENAKYNFSLEGVTFDKVEEITIKSHSSFTDEKAIYINLDNSGGYISNAQFVKFKNDLTKERKNVFVFLNEELNLMTSAEEKDIFLKMLSGAAENKNVFVFFPAENNRVYTENNVTFVTVSGIKNSSAKGVIYYPEDFGYYTVEMSDKPQIFFKSIFTE